MDMIYFELAQGSSMRLCLKMEEMFPDLRGRQLELMIQLCLVAYNSEIYDGVGHDAWLRTTVSFPECNSPDASVFSEGSVERGVMERIAALINEAWPTCSSDLNDDAWPTCWRDLQKLHRELAARVQIYSNIVPRNAHRQKLVRELQQHGSVTRQPFRRDFYPIRILADAVKESKSVTQKTKEWQLNGGRCVLADYWHLPSTDVLHAIPTDRLREVKRAQVNKMENLGKDVCKVSWRNGIYARKSFDFPLSFERERDVALLVSHPHIVHPIAQSSDVEDRPCLLMEALGSNLHRCAIEQDFVDSLSLGLMDALDALLQIARGMKSLHASNVVHGDLKPQNILISRFELSEDAPHVLVKITDFDQAQIIVPGEPFKPLDGTTKYAAPEVLKWTRLKEQDVPLSDPKKLDIYSFGSTAYEVLTGQGVYDLQVFSKNHIKRVVAGKLSPHGSIEDDDTSAKIARFNKFRICHLWQRVKETYPCELVQNVERCWELDPRKRPTSSKLCGVPKRSMSEMQPREKTSPYALCNFFVQYCIIAICALPSICMDLLKVQKNSVDFVVKIAIVMLLVCTVSLVLSLL